MNYSDFGVTCAEELEQDEWSLHGGVNSGRPIDQSLFGGIRTVLGWKNYASNGSSKLYIIHCSKCAEDSELFGDGLFSTTKTNFLSKRQGFCGCSKKPSLTKDQVMVKLKRLAVQKGHRILGYAEEYRGAKTRLELEDISTGKKWSSTCVNNYLHAVIKCPAKTELDVVTEIQSVRSEIEILGIHSNKIGKRVVTFKCQTCSHDEYVEQGLCNGIFTSLATDLLTKNTASCRCTKSFLWTEEQMLYRVNKEISKRNKNPSRSSDMKFVGWDGGKYLNNRTNFLYVCSRHGLKFSGVGNFLAGSGGCRECSDEDRGLGYTTQDFISLARKVHGDKFLYTSTVYSGWAENTEITCKVHGIFEQTPGSHLQGRGCPMCKGKTQTHCYINLVREYDYDVAIKFGIANDCHRRITIQNRSNLFKSENLGIWKFEHVRSCKAAEQECKQTLKTGVLSAREMKDGWTETVSVLDLEKVIAIYEKHGGKRIK